MIKYNEDLLLFVLPSNVGKIVVSPKVGWSHLTLNIIQKKKARGRKKQQMMEWSKINCTTVAMPWVSCVEAKVTMNGY